MTVYNNVFNDLMVFPSTILAVRLVLHFNNCLYQKIYLDICFSVICLYIPFSLLVLLVVILAEEKNKTAYIIIQFLILTERCNKIPFFFMTQLKNKQRLTGPSVGLTTHALILPFSISHSVSSI